MRTVTDRVVAERLSALEGSSPRVVVSGNSGTPWHLVDLLESSIRDCRAFVLNPQIGWP